VDSMIHVQSCAGAVGGGRWAAVRATDCSTKRRHNKVRILQGQYSSRCKVWGFHEYNYEECRLLGYKTPVRTSQETHYFSATESNQLMLRKIWGFHGGGYEECRLLGYKTPVRTAQETHYVSGTESSRLMLRKTWGFNGGGYEECCLLGYKTPVRTS
jgi:hypothetical protein